MKLKGNSLSVYFYLSSYVAGLLFPQAGLFFFPPALLFLFLRMRWVKGMGLCLLAMMLGAVRIGLEDPGRDGKHYRMAGTEKYVLIELCEEPEEREKTFRVRGRLLATGNDSVWYERRGFLQVYFPKDSGSVLPQYGERIWAAAALLPIEGFVGEDGVYFDYGAFMAKRRIYARVFLRQGSYSVLVPERLSAGKRIRKSAWELRASLRSFWHRSGLQGSELAVAKALVLGERSSDPIEAAYRKTGVIHVLAVSGMHLSIFSCMLVSILGFLKKKAWQCWLRFVLVLVPVWGYALLTGLSPSVCRAACMFSFVGMGKCMGRRVRTTRSLAISALFLLVWEPDLLYDMGFLLSYLAVTGLTLLAPVLSAGWHPSNRIPAFFQGLAVSSLAAQLATLPVILCVFGEFPTYFLLGNLVITPLVNIALPLGIAVSAFSVVWEPIARLLVFPMDILLRWMNWFVASIGKWPAAVTDISISLLSAILLYRVLAGLFVSVPGRNVSGLKWSLAVLLLFFWIG